MSAFKSNDRLLDAMVAEAEEKQGEDTLRALADKLQDAGAVAILPLLRRWVSAFRKWNPSFRGRVFKATELVSDLERDSRRDDAVAYAREELLRDLGDAIVGYLQSGRWYAIRVRHESEKDSVARATRFLAEACVDPLEG